VARLSTGKWRSAGKEVGRQKPHDELNQHSVTYPIAPVPPDNLKRSSRPQGPTLTGACPILGSSATPTRSCFRETTQLDEHSAPNCSLHYEPFAQAPGIAEQRLDFFALKSLINNEGSARNTAKAVRNKHTENATLGN
jgi:hypothetical protein